MSAAPPIRFQWTDEGVMAPSNGFYAKKADEQFAVGEHYLLAPVGGRTEASHNHYFAVIANAHENFPESLLEIYPTAEHLRKKALIRCGYRDEVTYTCESAAAARRLAIAIRHLDDFAIIDARENLVRIWTAKSQSKRAMPGKGEFQESKTKVLQFIDDLLGTKHGTVEKNEGGA